MTGILDSEEGFLQWS